jgi:hypothetical protein
LEDKEPFTHVFLVTERNESLKNAGVKAFENKDSFGHLYIGLIVVLLDGVEVISNLLRRGH